MSENVVNPAKKDDMFGRTPLQVPSTYLWSIDSKAFVSDLEFRSSVAERHEGQHPDKNADGTSRNALEGADIDCLTVITEPVTKVDAL